MPLFRERSHEKELLDSEGIPFEDIRRNMKELDLINHYLGGHSITIRGFQHFISNEDVPFSIVEVGCGGGDNLRAIKTWSEVEGLEVQLTGIDINPDCIRFAEEQIRNQGIRFISSDYRKVQFIEKPDIIFCSLFCHHFTNEELTELLRWLRANCKKGFFINDLHRHPLAYYSIKLLTKLFSRSYMVKNDAPLSVRRGFRRSDWEEVFRSSGISNFKLQWKWAFRWLITYIHEPRRSI